MRRARPALRRLALAALALALPACTDLQPFRVPTQVLACDSRAAGDSLQALAIESARVHIDAPGTDANLLALRSDVPATLAKLWPGVTDIAVTEEPGSPAPAPLTLWLSTGSEAAAAAGSPALEDGYVLRRIDGEGGITLLVYAPDNRNLAHGAYALLELLGARFFHPMEDFIPSFGQARIPATLDTTAKPWVKTRGTQLHLLHPIEYFDSFQLPGKAHLEEAKRVIDWLVKTGQNHLQWWLLGNADWEAYRPHATAIVDYAHARGLTVFAVVQLWGGASLQNGFSLVDDEDLWQSQLESGIDQILEVPFDGIELGLGEFFAADPAKLITWLDHGTAYAADKSARFSVVNHVGNYPELYVDYQGKKEFFYFLPRHADKRLINNVHTVFFFDLYREGGMYGHDNFHAHHDFLLEELPHRTMRYEPESAYWVTADVDVPVFLPEFIYSRWVDIHKLSEDIAKKGLPALEGHIMFTSGHEWGYWLTDYATAKMLWNPAADFNHFLSLYTSIYGSCSGDIQGALAGFIDVQTRYLFEKKLIPYVSGEDIYDDLGAVLGKETQLPRVPFEALLDMTAAEQSAFDTDVLGGLRRAAEEMAPFEATAAAACAGADAALLPYCAELRDGIQIVRLRILHAIRLYEAVLDHVRGGHRADALVAEAVQLTERAKQVIDAREPFYRFDVERLTGAYKNPTIYNFGYLRQAHTQCLWHRREDQVAYVLANGAGPSAFDLEVRACTD
jgi:hypothetical protein